MAFRASVAGVFHGLLMLPGSFWQQPLGWLTAVLAAAGLVPAALSLSGRIGRQHRYLARIDALRQHGDGILEIVCRPRAGWPGHRAGQFLFADEEVVAAGGNIMPVNGCTVRRGDLVETRIPRRHLARFQSVEYLRAFMAGRVGWATIRSLLVISGAFGVFHRRRVVDAHGYLTRSEHYLKDTVGEDMELVVRLTRNLCESRTPFAVRYAGRATCWTEIPETFRVLNRQRDRWRGRHSADSRRSTPPSRASRRPQTHPAGGAA